jgi:fumarylacetoacetate (FAA) hydrolase
MGLVMNDFSARALQSEEMKLNLGPAKGKDFATALGPWLVTLDELADRCVDAGRGDVFDLRMRAFHNERLVSEGNLKDMSWTFGEILERASYGAALYPGDVFGSGAVGTGCFLELNGTWALGARAMGRPEMPVWLQPGDVISLEIERLGTLTNTIVRAPGGRRILRRPTSPPGPLSAEAERG